MRGMEWYAHVNYVNHMQINNKYNHVCKIISVKEQCVCMDYVIYMFDKVLMFNPSVEEA